jgi:diguanylate cyclase (GGDEF)-like protein
MLVTTPNRREGLSLSTLLRKLPPAAVSALVVVLLVLVAWLDRVTGSAPAQHLYYVPIVLAGIRFRRSGAIAASLSAILLYHVANPVLLHLKYEEADFVQITLFIAVGLVTAKLTEDARRLHRLAMTDDLTGLHNLRSFEVGLTRVLSADRDSDSAPVAMLILDVDRLKSLNDRYGHLAGADAVRTVGHVIAAWSPPGSVACRYGGDEFAIALPQSGRAQAGRLADRLRRAVAETAPVLAGKDFPAGTLSISVGVACTPADPEISLAGSAENAARLGEWLFRAADAELYRAKSAGRNQTCVA